MSRRVFGLTGAIGAGKSAFAVYLARAGMIIINADAFGHEVLKITAIKKSLAQAFGPSIFSASGEVDRASLGAIAFSRPEALKTLNSITHPSLLERIRAAVDNLPNTATVIIDAALFLEWGFWIPADGTVVVDAPRAIRKSRLPGLTEGDFYARESSQLSSSAKRRAADFLIINDGDLQTLETKAQVVTHWINNELLTINKSKLLIV